MSTTVLRNGLFFGEGPRWHEGRLWYSDFLDHAVHAIDLDGNDERMLEVESQPSGLGWLPNGIFSSRRCSIANSCAGTVFR